MAWRDAFSGRKRAEAARRRPAYRPRLEVLEGRTLLSVYTVDRLTDANVQGGGQGQGLAGDLRYCLTQAVSGTDVVTFAVTGTINLGGFLPVLTHSVSIEGPGASRLTVRRDTGGYYRIFTVQGGRATVLLDGLTVTNGNGVDGGGISNYLGTLTISNSIITDNQANLSADGYSDGGGIWNMLGTLVVNNSRITDNTALGYRGGYAGAIENDIGTVTISCSTLAGNVSSDGGGIATEGGSMTISSSTLSGNLAYSGYGGAIDNLDTVLTVSNSTLAGNDADDSGAVDNTGPLTVQNSTISGNSAYGGGGVSTHGPDASLSLRNTILAGNTADDLFGPLTSGDHILIGGDPRLGPLADNGGPTQTMALLPYSPAIDAGDNADAPEWDQRGPRFLRIEHGVIDIGAFEYHFPPVGRLLPDPVAVGVLNLPPAPSDRGSPPDPVAVQGLAVPLPPGGLGSAPRPADGQPVPNPPAAEMPAGRLLRDPSPTDGVPAVATLRQEVNVSPGVGGLGDSAMAVDGLVAFPG